MAKREYTLFECTEDKDTCIKGICCPCILYADTYEGQKTAQGRSSSAFAAMCCYFMGMLTGLAPLCQCALSHRIYKTTEPWDDCVASCLCLPCKNCMDANNVNVMS